MSECGNVGFYSNELDKYESTKGIVLKFVVNVENTLFTNMRGKC